MAKRSAPKKASPAVRSRSASASRSTKTKKTAKASRGQTVTRGKAVARAQQTVTARPKKKARSTRANPLAVLFAPVTGAERKDFGHVQLEVGRAGAARVKRMIYPPGFHWAKDMKPVTGTDLCMHAHVGFLVHGEIHIEYADGCIVEHKAPQIIAIDPGHDGWVVGKDPVVLIEFDFERDTVTKLGMPTAHRHA